MSSTRKTKRPLKLSSQPSEFTIPNHFKCPISLDLMHDPVIISTGFTYDRHSIETWLDKGGNTCPVTNQKIFQEDLIPNHSLRRMIQDWCVSNRLNGVERIPTPRIPMNIDHAFELLSNISTHKNLSMVHKVRVLSKESEKNRKCFTSVGVACVLSKLFSEVSGSTNIVLQQEILSTMVCFLPLEYDACTYLASSESLNNITSILKFGDSNARLNAIEVLKEVLCNLRHVANVANDTHGLVEELVNIVEARVSSKSTKMALVVSYYMISFNKNIGTKFTELGFVPMIIELIVDVDKSLCEKGLILLDEICSSEKGREEACSHALCVAVLVKKMFRVSDMATEFVISVLWKLCKGCRGGEVVKEAIEVGGFQKILLLLQVGCSLKTKGKATELLKLMNGLRGKFECVDVMDFRGLKRSF